MQLDAVMQWRKLIVEKARKYNLHPSLVAADIHQESGGNHLIISPAGAVGLMQIMPDAYIKGRPTTAQLQNPEFNIDYGCMLLNNLRAQYRNQATMLAAYYGGIVQDAKGRWQPGEVKNYDGSITNGWDYVNAVEQWIVDYLVLDQNCNSDWLQYAKQTGTWLEVANNLKGVCNDGLQTGRSLRDTLEGIAVVAQEAVKQWGNR